MTTQRKYARFLFWLIFLVIIQLVTGRAAAQPASSRSALAVTVTASDDALALADTVVLTAAVSNMTQRTVAHVTLNLPTHPDLEMMINGRSATTSYSLGNLAPGASQEIILEGRVIGLPRTGQIPLSFVARGENTARVQTHLALTVAAPARETAVLAQAAFDQGRLTVTGLADGKGETAVVFQLTEQHRLLVGEAGNIIGFTLTSAQSEQAQMRLDISDLVPPELLSSNRLYLWHRATAADTWHIIPAVIEGETGFLTFESESSGQFMLSEDPEPWRLTYSPPGVSDYSGAAQFSYGIHIPPGVGGLAPSLSLHYGSRGVDDRRASVMSRGFGEGWSMPQAQISNGNAEAWYDRPGFNVCAPFNPRHFTLTLNGGSYPLAPELGVERYGMYIAVGDPSLHIEYKTDVASGNLTAEYWLVRTADGTQYRFGYTADAEQVIAPLEPDCGQNNHNDDQPRNENFAAASWKLDEITDRYGNRVQYIYQTKLGEVLGETPPESTRQYPIEAGGTYGIEVDVALDKIHYNVDGGQPQTEIDINYNRRNWDVVRQETFMRAGHFRPDEIQIKQAGNLVRRYSFNYEERHHYTGVYTTEFWWVTSITEYGVDENGNEVALLPTVLTYEQDTQRGCGSDLGGIQRCVSLLTRVANGYGGVTELFYDEMDNDGFWYVVTDVYTWDGVTHVYDGDPTTAASRTLYDRTGAIGCFDRENEGCDSPGSEESKALVGFDRVIINVQDPGDPSGTNLSRQEKTFNISSYWLNGKTLTSTIVDPSTPTIKLLEQRYDWTADPVGGGNYFSRLNWLENKQYAPDGSGRVMGTREVYLYETVHQGNRQWGHQTKTTFQFLNGLGTWETERTRITRYLTNETTWVIVPWMAGLYEGSTAHQLTLYYYDGSSDPTAVAVNLQSITQGELILSRAVLVDAPFTPPGGGTAYPTVDSSFAYDTFGNVTTVTSYTDYGAEGLSVGSSDWDYAAAPGSGSSGRTTQTQYSSDGLLVTQVTDAIGQITTFAYEDSFAGTDPSISRFTWLLTSVTDYNNLTTRYEYDPFGRLFAVYDVNDLPGSDDPWDGDPSQRYRYWDNLWNGPLPFPDPFAITVETKPDTYQEPPNPSGPDYNLNHITYYDGLGRAFQERSRYAEVDESGISKKDLVTVSEFNALGQVTCTTVPFAVDTNPVMVFANCDAQHPYTGFAYDALGRQTAVIAPDGSITSTSYDVHQTITVGGDSRLAQTEMTDAMGHVTQQFSNAWGQLVLVRNQSGSAGTGTTDYLDTQYHYDLAGNLERVQQRQPQANGQGTLLLETSLSYDALGRKISMDDPDMGMWDYVYDVNGQLIQQTDANGTVLCFAYDDLDRLLSKGEGIGSGGNPCAVTNALASYNYYDAAAPNGSKGQLESVRWGNDPANNYDTFFYDSQGRMVKQDRMIDGRLYSLETLSFDVLERPLTVQYPNGEVVTRTYDREGENSLQAGSDMLVDDIRYNARSQMTLVERGNDNDITYKYYGATGFGGDSNFRLQTIQHGYLAIDNLPDFTYHYDSVGNVVQMTATDMASGTDTQAFSYDHLNRLVTAVSSSGVADYNHSYSYDQLDNLSSITRAGVISSYHYNNPASQPHAVKSISGGTMGEFTYDANGNMIYRLDESGTYSQTFDLENRLIEVIDQENGGLKTGFVYDASGQRVQTTQPDGTVIDYPFPTYETERRARRFMSQVEKLLASDGSADGLFGVWVDVDGDTAVVGADADNNMGAVYVFVYDGQSWVEQAKLTPSDGNPDDYFGAVTIEGDTIVVGAAWHDSAAPNAGAVYIYERSGTTWSETAKLTASDANAYDYFGMQVDIWGNRIAVGALLDDEAGTNAGAAYIFEHNGTAWIETAKLMASDGAANNQFGRAVRLDGSKVVVGGEGNNNSTGAVYVFDYNGTIWNETIKLTASDGMAGDRLGWALDVDGDTILAGAWGHDSLGVDAGAAYVFADTGSGWNEVAKLTAAAGAAGDAFGYSTALDGGKALIGAWSEDTQGQDAGAAYVFTDNGNAWLQRDKLLASDGAAYDEFGISVALQGTTGLVGAFVDDDNGDRSGSVYVFEQMGLSPLTMPEAQIERSTYSIAGQATAQRTTVTLLTDDFSDGSADDWQVQSGTWNVVNGGYQQSAVTGIHTSNRPLDQADRLVMTWSMLFNSGDRKAGLHLFASQDAAQNHGDSYLIWQKATTLEIRKFVNNNGTTAATVPLYAQNGQGYNYQAIYNPAIGQLTVWRDGIQVLTWTDPDPLTDGAYIGLRTNGSSVQFDNLQVQYEAGLTYFHTDHLGSTRLMSQESGGLVDGSLTRYAPFGDYRGTRPAINPSLTDRGFTGHKHNDAVGLIYMNARYYVPGIGRFASADTIVPDPANSQGYNRYVYVYNNPLIFNDPSGHCIIDDCPWVPQAEWSDVYGEDWSYFTGEARAQKLVDYTLWLERDKWATGSDWVSVNGQTSVVQSQLGIELQHLLLKEDIEQFKDHLIFEELLQAIPGVAASSEMHLSGVFADGASFAMAAIKTFGWRGSSVTKIDDIPGLGTQGKKPNIRELSGTNLHDAVQFFNDLTVNADELKTLPNGSTLAKMPDGSHVTLRPTSSASSNYVPTVDVNSPTIGGYWKVKFNP